MGPPGVGFSLEPDHSGFDLRLFSLDDLIERYGPFDVMKMDCEGCEYGAIVNSHRIGELKQIQVEYHYGPEKIVEALKAAGFRVLVDEPRRVYDACMKIPDMSVGYIYAWR
jgi:hypothetical protein